MQDYGSAHAIKMQRAYADAQVTCDSQNAICDTLDQPEFARLNGRFSALLSEAIFNRDRIGRALSRLGRGQPETDQAACCPSRGGELGTYEDSLDNLDALTDTLRNFANVLEQIA